MTIQTAEQVAEALERDDCKPWDEDFRVAVVAALRASFQAGRDAAVEALRARAAEHRENYDSNAADWAIRYANYLFDHDPGKTP